MSHLLWKKEDRKNWREWSENLWVHIWPTFSQSLKCALWTFHPSACYSESLKLALIAAWTGRKNRNDIQSWPQPRSYSSSQHLESQERHVLRWSYGARGSGRANVNPLSVTTDTAVFRNITPFTRSLSGPIQFDPESHKFPPSSDMGHNRGILSSGLGNITSVGLRFLDLETR